MKYLIVVIFSVSILFLFFSFSATYQTEISDSELKQLKIADTFFAELFYDSAEYHYSAALECFRIEKDWSVYCSTTNNYITTLWRQEKYNLALKTAHQNLGYCIDHLGRDHPETARTYTNIGVLCFLTGHTGITHEYFVTALDIYNENFDKHNEYSAVVYEWLGIYHNSFSDTANARKYLSRALEIREFLGQTEDYRSGDLYRYLGLFYKRYSIFDSAFYCFNKAIRLFNEQYSEYNYKSVKCRNNIADMYEWFGGFDTAMAIHKHSLELIERTKAKNRYITMMTYFNISELYSNSNDIDNALICMQKVLKLYYPELDEQCITCNPKNPGVFPYSIIKVVLSYKARYFREKYYLDNKNYDPLIQAVEIYKLVHEVITAMRNGITNIEELIFHEHLVNTTYIGMAEHALLAYEITKDTSYLSQALSYLSISRNTDHILADKQLEYRFQATVPESYIQSKNQLKLELNDLLSRRSAVDKSDPDEPVNILIAKKKIELDVLSFNLAQDYPDIFESAYQSNNINLQLINERLEKGQSLIWFHENIGDYRHVPGSVLALVFSGEGVKYSTVEGKETTGLIKAYQKLVLEDINNLGRIDSVGHLLFTALFDPVKDVMTQDELIIIPSQHTGMIPFDALPVEEDPNPSRMIDKLLIRKEFSIHTFLKSNCPAQDEINGVLAVVPKFNNEQKEAIALLTKRDTGLINLPGAVKEVESIGNFFKTKILSGKNATKQVFENNCPWYRIIHFSTHGIPVNGNQSQIRLAFSDYQEDSRNGSLDVFEVLNLPVGADLVVLSACKTGVGEMNNGEGNINLAWAFNKSGANSVLVSLWNANDYASSVIMPKFYEYLAEGHTKPQALRRAKLDFIRSSDEVTRSPYFWGGFEYWGDGGSIVEKHSYYTVYISILSLLILIAFLLRKKLFGWQRKT